MTVNTGVPIFLVITSLVLGVAAVIGGTIWDPDLRIIGFPCFLIMVVAGIRACCDRRRVVGQFQERDWK